jgi:uncharacterized protein (TIGR03086 family)
MNALELLRASIDLTQGVIDLAPLDRDALRRRTPCAEFDVAQLIGHIIGTHQFLLGAVGSEPGAATGDVGDRHRAAGAASIATWTARGTDGTVHLGEHELPAPFALALHALEAFVHGWDLAAALGRPFAPPDDVVDVAWEAARVVVSDDIRSTDEGAPYGPEVAAKPDASSLDELIAFTGREW